MCRKMDGGRMGKWRVNGWGERDKDGIDSI
jgi:hypothetical protein